MARKPWRALMKEGSKSSVSSWLHSALIAGIPTKRSAATDKNQPLGTTRSTSISTMLRLGSATSQDDWITPVTSLDQIYLHATIIQNVFRRKVYEIARRSNGLLKRKPGNDRSLRKLRRSASVSGTVECELEAGNVLQYAEVEWSKQKSTSRGVEKVVRCYDGDSSRLVDVCRESIVYEHIQDIIVAVRCIKLDQDISVKRIKNRLDPDLDPWSTAGYRDVAIHLCLVCQEAYNLGLEGHVCELLLIPKDMHDIKIGSRHRKYVTWRNLRGQ
ncbi:hypothetical protein GUITHDRAFT_106661 [Guillardia theta CCMP2712]|uniref:Uncharacterized protein n=1 Tax=Guillardia theta (strain CCMP2712) TaxID=905079 RepID=L1JGM1_GUITC|nr:hypothetical protein GUITHDRAFT_106661 [Guillardia theta CCMP2712]EKX47673.1 hypothetical protein GUITHDRAFT_106661 [Guillardia theta CCMP2712]|eukprot:XP_005834653.1 hypothetical protein GUITHDRAFT_106661 [Guillardia theta CCMP2712]